MATATTQPRRHTVPGTRQAQSERPEILTGLAFDQSCFGEPVDHADGTGMS
ncbi:MAG TPA: hypothetical protein VFR68_03165 [Candidatus Dormibacteraeota bacterium]|nr:hypothetical protein [Candidatus Dormibacteraeota bacterium]